MVFNQTCITNTSITNITTQICTQIETTPNNVLVFGLIGVVLALLYFSFKLNEEHAVIKTIVSFFSVYLLSIVPYYLNIKLNDTGSYLFYYVYIIFIIILIAYTFIYFAYKLFLYLGNAWNKNKRFNMR